MSIADDLIQEQLRKKPGPLLGKTANMWGPTSDNPDVQGRLRAVLDNPTHDTWNNSHGIVVSPHRGLGGTTLWQAVRHVDPTFPHTGPVSDSKGNRVSGWSRIPDKMTIARALKHAATIKPRGAR